MIGAAVRRLATAVGVAPPGRPAAAWHARLAAACGVALVLLLPLLVAARHVGAPARADELARLERAFAAGAGDDGVLGRRYYRAAAWSAASMPVAPVARQQLVVRARVGQLAVLAGVVLVTYLMVVLGRGRLQAIAGCAGLALLAPIAQEGHVLRAETPAALFAAFAVLLLLCVPLAARRGARSDARQRWLLAGCAVLAIALAVATSATAVAVMLVPGLVLTIAGVQLLLRALVVGRRRGFARLPVRAANARLLPWTAMALAGPALTLWLLARGEGGPPVAAGATGSELGLLPENVVGAIAAGGLIVLGGAALLVRVGAGLRRTGRIGPDLVLLVYCAAVFGGALRREAGTDALPLVVAAAALLGEGAFTALLLATSGRGRRRGATSAVR